MDKEELAKFIIKSDMRFYLLKGFKDWGIEGTLEKIEKLYINMPVLRQKYIEEYWNLVKRKFIMEKKTILVTGGNGFIGTHTCNLLKNDYNILTWDLKAKGKIDSYNPNQFIGHLVDPDVPDRITEYLLENNIEKIDYIIHLAANISVPESNSQKDKYFLSNVVGTQKIIELAKLWNVKRLVFASSCAVYGADGQGVTLNDCKSFYAETKKMCEYILQLSDISTVILQYYNVYGPGQNPAGGAAIPNFVEKIKAGTPIAMYGDGSQIRDFVYVKDVAAANVAALTTPMEFEDGVETFEVGTQKGTSMKDAVHEIGTQLQMTYQCNFLPSREGDIPGFISSKDPRFNWEPKYTFESGIKDMLNEI